MPVLADVALVGCWVGAFSRPKPRIARITSIFFVGFLVGLGFVALPTGQGLSQLIIDNGEWIIVFSVGWVLPYGITRLSVAVFY